MSETETTPAVRAPRKQNALDNPKLNMMAPCPTAQGKMSKLMWNIINNNPRLTVFTNDPAEQDDSSKGNGKLSANLDIINIYCLIELIEKAINAEPGWKEMVENRGFKYVDDQKSENPEKLSVVWVGKEKDGRLWIAVVVENRPTIRFYFTTGDWHNYMHGDGTPYTAAEASALAARGYVALLRLAYAHLAITEFKEAEPRPPGGYPKREGGGGYPKKQWQGGGSGGGGYPKKQWQGGNNGGGGGGYNRGGGGGGNYQQNANRAPAPQAPVDVDLPF